MTDSRQQPKTSAAPSPVGHHDNHGQSLAAWTTVVVIMLGSLVMAIAVVFPSLAVFIVGAVVVVAGLVAGKVLSGMGFGVSGRAGH
jgi:uncharacterized membrane protein